MGTQRFHRFVAALGAAVLLIGLLAGCAKSSTAESAATSVRAGDITIALSNSFIGNTWRQTMIKVFEKQARDAKAKGLIKDFSSQTTSQNTATEQIAQIQSLILKKPSAIVINSASPTALNPVIKQACDAGIVVITFDSIADEPCAYKVEADFDQFGQAAATGVVNAMGKNGNLLVVRGVVGSAPEKKIYDGQMKVLRATPDVKVVTELQGEASNSVTQQVVQQAIPSLPEIRGVITGGSTYGALQAFLSAGKPVPFGNFSNDGVDLALWKQFKQKDPNYSATSVRPDPGQSAFALYMALEILAGKQVPKYMVMPNVVVTDGTLDTWLRTTPESHTAAWQWTQEQVRAAITAQAAGQAMPTPPPPTETP